MVYLKSMPTPMTTPRYQRGQYPAGEKGAVDGHELRGAMEDRGECEKRGGQQGDAGAGGGGSD
jgi:hypothetical protein